MKLTNKFNLPQTLINLHEKQRKDYSETRGDADVSVTQIIRPPRIDMLRKEHFKDMEEDLSDRLWAILGTVIHVVMVDGADEEHIPEENLFIEIEGWILKGGIDVQHIGVDDNNQIHVRILDYKFTRAIKYQKKDYQDWQEQLNCYAYMVTKCKGYIVDGIDVVMFVRDFSGASAERDKSYPPASCCVVDIHLWSVSKQEEFIREHILEHQDARRRVEWGEDLLECSDHHRWKRPDEWTVQKPGAKRASKVTKTEAEADEWRQTKKKPDEYEVTIRKGHPSRCEGDWCGVSRWCDQWLAEKKEMEDAEAKE